jgi:hypothetical protein
MTDTVEYHKKRDGVLRIAGDRSCRFLTLWERIVLFFGGKP